VSRHWKPEGKIARIIPVRERGPWGSVEDYLPRGSQRRRSAQPRLSVALGAVLVGAVVGLGWANWPQQAAQYDPSAIEWNSVQAVPTRTLSADQVEWQNRGVEEASPSTSSGAMAQAVSARFGYCHTGGGTNCVVDGDTFYLGGEKVRIAGIDAPETHPPRCADEARLGNQATEKLNALLNSGAVTMTSIDRDRDTYGRLLRNVAVNGHDVGEAMISAGVAREYGSGRRPWCG
jgi:endonuclease YncB( thermonuclease family)